MFRSPRKLLWASIALFALSICARLAPAVEFDPSGMAPGAAGVASIAAAKVLRHPLARDLTQMGLERSELTREKYEQFKESAGMDPLRNINTIKIMLYEDPESSTPRLAFLTQIRGQFQASRTADTFERMLVSDGAALDKELYEGTTIYSDAKQGENLSFAFPQDGYLYLSTSASLMKESLKMLKAGVKPQLDDGLTSKITEINSQAVAWFAMKPTESMEKIALSKQVSEYTVAYLLFSNGLQLILEDTFRDEQMVEEFSQAFNQELKPALAGAVSMYASMGQNQGVGQILTGLVQRLQGIPSGNKFAVGFNISQQEIDIIRGLINPQATAAPGGAPPNNPSAPPAPQQPPMGAPGQQQPGGYGPQGQPPVGAPGQPSGYGGVPMQQQPPVGP